MFVCIRWFVLSYNITNIIERITIEFYRSHKINFFFARWPSILNSLKHVLKYSTKKRKKKKQIIHQTIIYIKSCVSRYYAHFFL